MLFDKAYASTRDDDAATDSHGDAPEGVVTLQNDGPIPLHTIPAPLDLQPFIKQSKVVLHARLKLNGVVYARSSTHLGNSLVHYYVNGDKTSPPTPGCIKYIFESNDRISFAVQRQLPIHDGSMDPFRNYPHFPVSMYSADLSLSLEVVQIEWVMGHFA